MFKNLFYFLCAVISFSNGHTEVPKSIPKLVSKSVQLKVSPIIFGSPNAPVKIIEYSSPTCDGCQSFIKEILPLIEKEYPDSVCVIVQGYPRDQLDLKISLLIHSSPNPSKSYKMFYGNAIRWMNAKNMELELKAMALENGINTAHLDKLFNDKDPETIKLQNELIQVRYEGETNYGIDGVPEFLIGKHHIVGCQKWKVFKSVIEQALVFVKKGYSLKDFEYRK